MTRAVSMPKRFIQVLLFLSIFLQISGQSKALAANETNWLINQTCGVLGDQTIFITPTWVRIDDMATGLVTMSSAPDWKVITFDKKTKMYAECPLSNYQGYIEDREFVDPGIRWQKLPLVPEKTATIAGVEANSLITPPSFEEKQIKDLQQESAAPTFAKDARYCFTTKVPADKHISSLLSRFYQLPEKNGLPLQFKYHTIKGDLNTWLYTTSIKKSSSPEAPVTVPNGFRKAASALDIRMALRKTQAEEKTKKHRPLL